MHHKSFDLVWKQIVKVSFSFSATLEAHNYSRLCRSSQQLSRLIEREEFWIINLHKSTCSFCSVKGWTSLNLESLKWSYGSPEFLLLMVWTICVFLLDFSPESYIFQCTWSKTGFSPKHVTDWNEFAFTMLVNAFNEWNIKMNNWFWVMRSTLNW